MKLAFRTVIGVLLLASPALHADDWPMLGGRPDRNLVSAEKGLPATWGDDKDRKNVKWMMPLGSGGYGTPAIAGGRVVVGTTNEFPKKENPYDPAVKGDKGILLCFSEADGKLLWQAVHDKLETGDAEDATGIGICSTPAIVGDRVYYVSNRAELVCRAANDGKVVWSIDLRKQLGVSPHQGSASSPVVVGDLVFVHTGHGSDYKKNKVLNPKAPSFIAVDRSSGKIVWQDSSPGDKIIAGQWSSPAYAVVDGRAQVLFAGGDGWLYSFDPPSGKPLWKFNCKAHEKVDAEGKTETGNYMTATPVVVGHRVILCNGTDTDGNGPGAIRAIDARKSGDVTATAELWKIAGDEYGVSISTVAVHDGLVYCIEQAGFVECLELETGKRLWKHDALSGIWGSPLLADGKLYVRNGDGETLVFQAGREKKLLAKNGGLSDVANGSVVAANGVLFLAGGKKLYAIAESK